MLPTLTPEETDALADDYLRAGKGKVGEPAMALVFAAAALYGTSLATGAETRLLDRVHLLRRKL